MSRVGGLETLIFMPKVFFLFLLLKFFLLNLSYDTVNYTIIEHWLSYWLQREL